MKDRTNCKELVTDMYLLYCAGIPSTYTVEVVYNSTYVPT